MQKADIVRPVACIDSRQRKNNGRWTAWETAANVFPYSPGKSKTDGVFLVGEPIEPDTEIRIRYL